LQGSDRAKVARLDSPADPDTSRTEADCGFVFRTAPISLIALVAKNPSPRDDSGSVDLKDKRQAPCAKSSVCFDQLVLSDQLAGGGRDYGVVSLTNWRIGDPALKHKLLVGGLGWTSKLGGSYNWIFATGAGPNTPCRRCTRPKRRQGPAGRWLIERLVLSPPKSGETSSRLA
jgi:hypothetical protein